MKTLEAEPQRICVVTGGPLAEELQEAANEPGVFDKARTSNLAGNALSDSVWPL